MTANFRRLHLFMPLIKHVTVYSIYSLAVQCIAKTDEDPAARLVAALA